MPLGVAVGALIAGCIKIVVAVMTPNSDFKAKSVNLRFMTIRSLFYYAFEKNERPDGVVVPPFAYMFHPNHPVFGCVMSAIGQTGDSGVSRNAACRLLVLSEARLVLTRIVTFRVHDFP